MDRNVLSSSLVSMGLGIFALLVGRINSDLDRDGPTADILAFESRDCLFLLFLVADVDKAVAFALPGLTPASANDASGFDDNASICEQSGETFVINIEPEVGHKEHILGRLANGIFTSWTGRARGPGLANALGLLGRWVSRGICSRGRHGVSGVAFRLCLGLALNGGKRLFIS